MGKRIGIDRKLVAHAIMISEMKKEWKELTERYGKIWG